MALQTAIINNLKFVSVNIFTIAISFWIISDSQIGKTVITTVNIPVAKKSAKNLTNLWAESCTISTSKASLY